ncbi:MAG: TIGR02300 family protein [Lactobacillales bacterium]|jgi:uncharacterized protein (TIGR02300 family)|nr:TIGR02300 family protein [Lactobacillales bacterium]
MTKPEWGNKRKCLKCGAFFYDMKKDPFTCPKCGEKYSAETYDATKNKKLLKLAKKSAPKIEDETLDEEALLQMTEDVPLEGEEIGEDGLDILEDSDDITVNNPEINEIMDNFDDEDQNNN